MGDEPSEQLGKSDKSQFKTNRSPVGRRFQNIRVAFGFQQSLGLDRGHSARPRRCDGLPILMILHVARREHAVNVGTHIVFGDEVAAEREEHGHAQHTAGRPAGAEVVGQHRGDRDRPQAVEAAFPSAGRFSGCAG